MIGHNRGSKCKAFALSAHQGILEEDLSELGLQEGYSLLGLLIFLENDFLDNLICSLYEILVAGSSNRQPIGLEHRPTASEESSRDVDDERLSGRPVVVDSLLAGL